MIIEPFHKYRIISYGNDKLKYEWNIHTIPEKRAWKLVGEVISVGSYLNNGEYKVLFIEKLSDQPIGLSSENVVNFHEESISRCTTCFGKLVIDCRMCDGSGFNCRRCNGTGKTYCVACRGGQGKAEGFTFYN